MRQLRYKERLSVEPQLWECLTLSDKSEIGLQSEISDAGGNCWELVSVVYDPHGRFVAFLKRPRTEEPN